jgi:predicted acetyltransferase
MPIDVRLVHDEDFDAWSDAISEGFLNPKNRGDGPRRRRWFELDRSWGAFDGARPVGTLRGIKLELTVPGGAFAPLDGISGVTVAASHRRRGLLSRMMAGELGAARERGEYLAGLYAAEYPIYERYGFGAAVPVATWYLDARKPEFVRELPGTMEIVDLATALDEAPKVYEAVRAANHGVVSCDADHWRRTFGQVPREGETATKDEMYALCRDEAGNSVGFLRYRFPEERFTRQRPDCEVVALDLLAVSVDYEARLWKFLADHDWVTEVRTAEGRREDELWRDLLVDRRAAWCDDEYEGMWLRVLDPAAALAARRYEVPGRIVLRVTDKDGYADGTFALEGGPDGAQCSRSSESADVTLPASVLASIYLGGFSAARHARLGLIDEERPGAVARLAPMFHTAIAPWAPTGY